MPQEFQQAIELRRQGRLAEAEHLCRQVLQGRPRDFDALHLLGALRLEQGDPQEALRLIGAALELTPRSAAAHGNLGLALAALRRHEEALASFDQALALDRRNVGALVNRADTLCDLGRAEEALASYDKTLAVDPRHVAALVNRGVLLRELGRPAEALESYDRALAVDGNDAAAWNNRGVALADLGRHTEALASYERALALQPDYVEALCNRGNALLELKQPAEALVSYGRALLLRPDAAEIHVSRGHAFYDLGRFDEALAGYERAIALVPGHPDARLHRARALSKLDRHGQAIAEYATLRAGGDHAPSLLGDLLHAQASACAWSDLAPLAAEMKAVAIDGSATIDPFTFLSLDATPAEQLACARNWLRRKKIAAAERRWNPAQFDTGRIRIAYLSADYHRHATAHLIAELFEIHDRTRFEVIGVSFGPDDGSPVRARLIRAFDRFFDVAARTNAEAAKLLRDLNVQIAVDLKGYTTDARLGILAERAAPIQVSYLGYPGTTGADFIDYVIADPIVLPFDQQPFYTEKIVHLPDSYQVNDRQRPLPALTSRHEAGLPDDALVFCCFNNTWKITAPVFDVWMRLLGAVPGSVLWLYQSNRAAVANLREAAAARAVNPARIVFAPPLDLPQHLARVPLADLFLDTLPYNAHTTASDALWSGVPVVTCRGATFQGRVGASLLHGVGLAGLVAENLEQYHDLALRFATDLTALAGARQKLVDNRRCWPLFDTDRFRSHIEDAYTTMWDTFRRGEDPRAFSIAPIGAAPPRA